MQQAQYYPLRERGGAIGNNDTYYYIKNADNPGNQCVAAGDNFDGNIYLQPHNNRANAKWKFEPAIDGFYYIIDNRHGCALGTGLNGPQDRNLHHCDKQKTDWIKFCQWQVLAGKKPGTYIFIDRLFCLGFQADQSSLQVHAPRISQLNSQWVLETAVEGEDSPGFIVPPDRFLDENFFKNIVQGGLGIDVNAASPPCELAAPEAEQHRFSEKTPWVKEVTRDRSIVSVYQRVPRNPSLRYETNGNVIENVVVENDSPNAVITAPPAHVDENREYRFFFTYMPSKNAVARIPYSLMGTTLVSGLLTLDSPESTVVKIAAVGSGMCYVLHAKDGASLPKLSLADFQTNRIKSIPLPMHYPFNSCEICWNPQERKLLFAEYVGNQCFFRRYEHGGQNWDNQISSYELSKGVAVMVVALTASGDYYLLDSQGNLHASHRNDLGQPPGLWNLKVTSDEGVWGFFGLPGPSQRICVLYEDASGKPSWHPVLEPKSTSSKTPNGYDDKDKENSQGIACTPISSTQALCWPLATRKAKRPLYRLSIGAVDQPPLPFPAYTDEEEKNAYKFIANQLLEASGTDLRSRYVRISPTEANNYLTQLLGLTPKPADKISKEKFLAVRNDLVCELTYLVFAKNLFNELHLHVLTSQMVNDHAMDVVAKAFDIPTTGGGVAENNPETILQGIEMAETAIGGTSAVIGTVSAGLGAAAVTTASLAGAAAVTGVGAAIIGLVAIGLAIAAAIMAAEEEKKQALEQPPFKVTVNDSHYVINATLAGIRERVDQIFVGTLDQFEAWRKIVSQDLGALIVVGRLAKAQVWSTEDLPRVDDPRQLAEIEKASQTTLKTYYEVCVRTYAKALLPHFMMLAVLGGELPDRIFKPRPTNTYPRYPFWGWESVAAWQCCIN